MSRLLPVNDIQALAAADLVIEAASERLEVKKALFKQLGDICPPQTLLAVTPRRFRSPRWLPRCAIRNASPGLHFFNPAPVMKLVEVVSGLDDRKLADLLCELAQNWKRPVPVCWIYRQPRGASVLLRSGALEENVAPAQDIDAALREAGGFPMEPLELTDLSGRT